jgi:hypothetical protein
VVTNELELVLGTTAPDPATAPLGFDSLTVRCSGDAPAVLALARDTFASLLRNLDHSLDDLAFWQATLPSAFVTRCSPEMTPAEARAFLRLPYEERMRERPWSLRDWLYWFRPDERQWYWGRAECPDNSTITVEIQPEGWPYPHGALDWLFIASGAQSIEADD